MTGRENGSYENFEYSYKPISRVALC